MSPKPDPDLRPPWSLMTAWSRELWRWWITRNVETETLSIGPKVTNVSIGKMPMTNAMRNTHKEPYAALEEELHRASTWFDDLGAAVEGSKLTDPPIGSEEFLRLRTKGEALLMEAKIRPELGLHLFMALKNHGAGYLAQAPFLTDYETFCAFFEIPTINKDKENPTS